MEVLIALLAVGGTLAGVFLQGWIQRRAARQAAESGRPLRDLTEPLRDLTEDEREHYRQIRAYLSHIETSRLQLIGLYFVFLGALLAYLATIESLVSFTSETEDERTVILIFAFLVSVGVLLFVSKQKGNYEAYRDTIRGFEESMSNSIRFKFGPPEARPFGPGPFNSLLTILIGTTIGIIVVGLIPYC